MNKCIAGMNALSEACPRRAPYGGYTRTERRVNRDEYRYGPCDEEGNAEITTKCSDNKHRLRRGNVEYVVYSEEMRVGNRLKDVAIILNFHTVDIC